MVASLALAASPLVVGPAGIADAATGATVSSFITMPDASKLLSPGPSQVFNTDGVRPGNMITIEPTQTFQTMDGFGASITDSSAALLYQLPVAQRTQVMESIFSPSAGTGMSFLRQPIGASDFTNEGNYSYNDIPSGQTDFSQTRFSIAHDESQILPLLRQALALNPSLKVIGSPWGQPAWMKNNNSMINGQLKDDPAIFRAYALYLVKFVQAYEAAGVPIYGLTVQNEPQNRTPDDYPGTDMPVAHQAAVINELGPQLRDAGLSRVKIMSYDHNWSQHPGDAADAAALGVPAEPNYPYDVLRTSAAQWIAGTAYHCYAGDPTAQTALKNAFPSKDIWFTECSGFRGNADSQSKAFGDTLQWHAKNIIIGTTRNWARSVVNWNLALDSNGKPSNGGCGSATDGVCTAVVRIDGTTVNRNAEYYTLGHASRFVKAGAVRVGSNNAADVHNVAFRNPDGSYALVLANTGGGTQTFGVTLNGMFVSYTIAPGALMTLTWGATAVDNTPPSAPGNVIASGTTASATTLTWSASTDTQSGISGYTVFRNGVQVGTTNATTTSFTNSGLTANTTYTFTVRAADGAGNNSAVSAGRSVTTLAADTTPPSTPTNLAASATTAYATTLSWTASTDASGIGGYTVFRNGTQVGTTTGTATTYTDSALSPSTTYTFTVSARDTAGNVSGVSAGLGVTTLAGTVIDATRWYQVINQNSSKCLDDADFGTGNGSALQQWACNTPISTNQSWQFRPTSNGYYQVVSRHAPISWDVAGGAGATGDGTTVHLWTYGGGTNQQWMPVAMGGGVYKFVARHSGKCLDVRDVSTSDGARLQQWTCSGGPAQSFRLN